MSPGVTNRPAASTTTAPSGAGMSPSATATILPPESRIDPRAMVTPVPSISVAPRMRTGGPAGDATSYPSAMETLACHGGAGRSGGAISLGDTEGGGGGGAAEQPHMDPTTRRRRT